MTEITDGIIILLFNILLSEVGVFDVQADPGTLGRESMMLPRLSRFVRMGDASC